ncbi:MAG TPA: S41 family peptidase [Mycobacteriales bacterium]|jgi:hypothetical protein|nr:S41 family peptidase [Mycobacteriales bacterium]
MQPRDSPYLPADAAYGCEYAFDPESAWLRQAILKPARYHAEPLRSVDLVADLSFLRHLLEMACAGYDELLRHPEFDPDEFFSVWADKISINSTVDVSPGIVEPFRSLRRLVPNGHLTVAGFDPLISNDPSVRFREYQAPAAVAMQATDDVPDDVRHDTLRTASLLTASGDLIPIATVSAAGDREAILTDTATWLPRRTDSARDANRAAYEWHRSDDTGFIILRSFQYGDPVVRGQLDQFVADYQRHAACRRLIFDLRGNGGGNLEPIREWLAQACPAGWTSWSMLEIMGPIAVCKMWNWTVEWQIRNNTVDISGAQRERETIAAQWPQLSASAPTLYKSSRRPGGGSTAISSEVYVLVDRRSGSSGELAAIELKRAVGATVLGERTAGAFLMGQAARFVLPRTGLIVQVPTQWAQFEERMEGVGWPVDIYLEDIAMPATDLLRRLPMP